MKESLKRFEDMIRKHDNDTQDENVHLLLDYAVELEGSGSNNDFDNALGVFKILHGSLSMLIADVRVQLDKDLLPLAIELLNRGVPDLERQLREMRKQRK
jgi:hypothetical protein